MEVIHAFGYSPEELSVWHKISIAHPENPLAASIRTDYPIFIESREQFERDYPALAARPALSNHQAILALPLSTKGQTIGAIGLSFAEPRIFDEKDKNYLFTIAQHCSQALERARLYEVEKKARAEAEAMQERLAVLAEVKERNRLAGELHDTVAQALGYLNLKMATLITELEQGQLAEAQNNLNELKQIVGETYTDVREEIFNLRSSFAPGIEFLAALQDYIAKYKRFYDLDIDLQINAKEQDFRFSAEVGIQLIRTIQEALINIRKHAQINKAMLRLEKDQQGIRISIEDEGAGFDPDQLIDQGASSFGLQIMRERIEKVGGRLEIDSIVGRGTRIILHYTHPE